MTCLPKFQWRNVPSGMAAIPRTQCIVRSLLFPRPLALRHLRSVEICARGESKSTANGLYGVEFANVTPQLSYPMDINRRKWAITSQVSECSRHITAWSDICTHIFDFSDVCFFWWIACIVRLVLSYYGIHVSFHYPANDICFQEHDAVKFRCATSHRAFVIAHHACLLNPC